MSNRELKFVFTYNDIARIKGVSSHSVTNAVYRGDLNPNDLSSITRYVYSDAIKDLKQTLIFWKKKAKGLETSDHHPKPT